MTSSQELPSADEIPAGGESSGAELGHLQHYEDNGLADYIAMAKYAQYRPDLGRWETYPESVKRVEAMHRAYFHKKLKRRISGDVTTSAADPADHRLLCEELGNVPIEVALAEAFAAVAAKRVLPSLRTLQLGGDSILRNQAKLYNCAFSPVDRSEFFREYFFLLLSGTGCGFSVQHHHVTRLPIFPPRAEERYLRICRYPIADSTEGWADALHELIRSHLEGFVVRFDFGLIRPSGEPLGPAGGLAPGPEPLRGALEKVATVLRRAAGRRLDPIEVYDICMHVSQAGMRAGGRRAASICLFSSDDQAMMMAKTGAWLTENPQRSASNNSAVLSAQSDDHELFLQLFEAQKEYGEPGFYFSSDPEYGCNPCGETGLHPVLVNGEGAVDEETRADLRALGYNGELAAGVRLSGWQMCNLTTINGTALRTTDEFFSACLHAAVIGTFQAAYTNMPYLGPITRAINERDALLGVSICGFMDNPGMLFAPRILERGARICRAANQLIAATIGIRPAARVTCVKPEGTAALLLGAAAGIHPRPAHYYFRRVRVAQQDPIYQAFHSINPHLTERSLTRPGTDDIIVFPIEAPAHAIVRDDLSAVEFLERVMFVQQHWVLPGEAPGGRSVGLHHSVSQTCAVRSDEWSEVADYIWRHRGGFSGVALLGDEAAQRYVQPPLQPVRTKGDVAEWNRLSYHHVDFAKVMNTRSDRPLPEPDPCVTATCNH